MLCLALTTVALRRGRFPCDLTVRQAFETTVCSPPPRGLQGKGKRMEAKMNRGTASGEVRLRGRALFICRVIWIAFALFNLVLSFLNLLQPVFGGQIFICPLTFTCPASESTLQILKQAQIPLAAYDTYVLIFGLIFGLIFLAMSVLLFWRAFDQPIGLFASFAFLFIGFAVFLGNPPSTVPPALVGSISLIQTSVQHLCLGFFLVTFPDGRFVPRWSWLIGCTLFVQGVFFQLPGPLNILSWPFPLIVIELVLAYGSPIAIQVYRYRRVSSPAQRQQTRWVILGLASALLLLFVSFFSGALFPPLSLYQLTPDPFSSLAFLLIPLSISIAILRSRLWDIDVIINRALVYGLLTITLALIYTGVVFGAQALLVGFIRNNDGIVIVGSTLIVAALFQPLRRGIQAIIDRRFYRRKYDAVKTLAAFSTTLRQEVDLEQLREQLVAVVQETMQPSHVWLWLRPPEPSRKRQTWLLARIDEEERVEP